LHLPTDQALCSKFAVAVRTGELTIKQAIFVLCGTTNVPPELVSRVVHNPRNLDSSHLANNSRPKPCFVACLAFAARSTRLALTRLAAHPKLPDMPSVQLANGRADPGEMQLQPATGPCVWRASDCADDSWARKLDATEVQELEAAVASVSHIERFCVPLGHVHCEQ